VDGPFAGELSPGTYKDFFAAVLRRAFTAVADITALTLTIAGAGPTFTVTRSAGSWITDGLKNGNMVRITAGAFNAANLNKNLFILSLTATVLTVMPLNGVALVAEGPIASATVNLPGKKTFAPISAHTDVSFAIEHWHSTINDSELFLGCKMQNLDIGLPPTGIATVGMQFMGKDMTDDTAQYFTSPTAETTTGLLAAVNGLLAVQGAAITSFTGFNASIKPSELSADPVVGSNTFPAISPQDILVDGQFTAMFESGALRGYFDDETEVALICAFAASNAAAADFMTFSFPRVKVGSADPDDGKKHIVRTFSFKALYNSAGGAAAATEQSAMAVQDSQA